MKKTITLTSKPIYAESLQGTGGAVKSAELTVAALAELIFEFVPNIRIEFLNRVDEETPCNQDRNLFYVRLSMTTE